MLNLPILNVRIQPCPVGEQHLTPQAQGHHCALCNRLVQDFTRGTQAELEQARAASPDGRVCGRFTSEQLVRAVQQQPKLQLRRFLVALMLVCGLGLTRQEALAQFKNQSSATSTSTQPYGMYAEQMPVYKNGGSDAVLAVINKNLRYPVGHTVVGRVFVTFTIDKKGVLRDPTIARGLGAPFDQEALRAVNLLEGPWTPGYQNGQPVDVRYTVPINFQPPRKPAP